MAMRIPCRSERVKREVEQHNVVDESSKSVTTFAVSYQVMQKLNPYAEKLSLSLPRVKW